MFVPDGMGHRLHHSNDWSYHEPSDWDVYRPERIALGIRLGQRWCSVSSIEDGKVTDIINKIPSLVTFTPNKVYYGADAIRHSIQNISNSIYQFFGLLGKKYDDKSVQQLTKHLTYNIVKINRETMIQIPKYDLIDEDIGIPIQFTSTSKPRILTVIEIVSQFLEHVLKEAEEKIGCPIAHVAISTPNQFGQLQRLALLQAAKLSNIEPVRLVTSCMAASVCLRYYHKHNLLPSKEENKNNEDEDDDKNIEEEYNGHSNGYGRGGGGVYARGRLTNGTIQHKNGYNKHHHTKKRKKKKKEKKNHFYLIADISNIACSLSVVECKEKRYSDIIKVQHCTGDVEYGIWKMINSFSLYVVKSFVDGYRGYYRPNLEIITNDKKHKQKHKKKKNKIKKNKNKYFHASISKYNYKNDVIVYDQLQQIETIEKSEKDDDDETHIHQQQSHSDDDEALKCRFRSQMLCDTIIEHLHDQYKNEEVQIHYEKFYRSFSLQLILTTKKLHEIALTPFLFNMINCIDKILQESKNKVSIKQIDQCVLVGDGGNIPEVVALFSEYFNLNHAFESQPIVARGCAIVCAVDQELIANPISLDLLPYSIRMEDALNQGNLSLIIGAQNPCPCKKTIARYTYIDNQTTYRMKFYEGESSDSKLCQLIGIFEIRNIPKRSKRDTKIVIAIHVDRNCVLMVSAEDVTAKPPAQLDVVRLQH